jgi:hypothetical protein
LYTRPSYQDGAHGISAARGVPDVAGEADPKGGWTFVTGSNIVNTPPVSLGGYQAGPGWDPATGWGSPDAQVLVPLLAT